MIITEVDSDWGGISVVKKLNLHGMCNESVIVCNSCWGEGGGNNSKSSFSGGVGGTPESFEFEWTGVVNVKAVGYCT